MSYIYLRSKGARSQKSLYGIYRGGFALLQWQFTPWFLVITVMGWIIMVFFCFADGCTSLETKPYATKQECELNTSVAVDAVLSVEGITFFQVRCEQQDV